MEDKPTHVLRVRDPFQLEALEPRVLLSADGVVSLSPGNPEIEQPFSDVPTAVARVTAPLSDSQASVSGSEWFADLGALPSLEGPEPQPSLPAFPADVASATANPSESETGEYSPVQCLPVLTAVDANRVPIVLTLP